MTIPSIESEYQNYRYKIFWQENEDRWYGIATEKHTFLAIRKYKGFTNFDKEQLELEIKKWIDEQ